MPSLLPLLPALLGLLVGPALFSVPHWRRWDRLLDSFTITAVGGLCLLHLIPEAVERGGWLALVLVGLGMAAPIALQRLASAGPWMLLAGLGVHAALEAAALASHGSHGLGAAVVLHRVPVGLAVFAQYHDHPRNLGGGWLAIGALSAATVAGYLAGPGLHHALDGTTIAGLDALVAGLLLHVILWHDEDHSHDAHPVAHGRGGHGHGDGHHQHGPAQVGPDLGVAVAAGLGLIVASGFVVGGHAHDGGVLDVALETALRAAPLVVAAYIGAGLAYALGPWASPTRPGRAPARTTGAQVVAGLRTALTDLVDRTLPWVAMGLLVAACFGAAFDLQQLPGAAWLQVPVAALLGLAVQGLAAPAGPLAAVGVAAAVSPGTGLALLLSGPAAMGSRSAVGSGAGRAVLALLGVVVLGWSVDAVIGLLGGVLHALGSGPVAWASLALLGLLALGSLVRLGPRRMASALWLSSDAQRA